MASGHKPCLTEIKRGLGAAQRQIMLSSFLVINEQAPLGRSKKTLILWEPPTRFPRFLDFSLSKMGNGANFEIFVVHISCPNS